MSELEKYFCLDPTSGYSSNDLFWMGCNEVDIFHNINNVVNTFNIDKLGIDRSLLLPNKSDDLPKYMLVLDLDETLVLSKKERPETHDIYFNFIVHFLQLIVPYRVKENIQKLMFGSVLIYSNF